VQSYLIGLVNLIVTLVTVLIIANSLISFLNLEPWHPVRRTLNQMTEPILRPFRNVLPPVGMFDLSPLIALIVIQVLGQLVVLIIQAAF
jgi:YggT family protein